MIPPEVEALPDGAVLEPEECDPTWLVVHEFARDYNALVERTGIRLQLVPSEGGWVLALVRSEPGKFVWMPEYSIGPLH